ncbi:hypothetical protein Pme01_35910 [Planosporangium mesophilum]|uniref:Phosphate-starvation-inducible E n=1 Tax=Planosporangium mesophilum TaxID=689768 RepID=A0A8J3TCW7_9ACTN|nr:hypothetical protein Pme01_35910 [Planosporangium mesophilum]
MVNTRGVGEEKGRRSGVAVVLNYSEFFLNAAVAVALGVGGFILLGVVAYDFVQGLGHGPFVRQVLQLLSGLLLVFIFTELIGTLRVVIATREVKAEPFLVVGIVASIRRVIVVGAEAENAIGTARFKDVMLEIGVLSGTVLVLGVTFFVLRMARAEEPPTSKGPTERL